MSFLLDSLNRREGVVDVPGGTISVSPTLYPAFKGARPFIREAQSKLATVNATASASGPSSESREHFLSSRPICGNRVKRVRCTRQQTDPVARTYFMC